MKISSNELCLCGSNLRYQDCCENLHLSRTEALTPEQLMRARFTAYALKMAPYIYNTYATEKQPENCLEDIAEFANSSRFIHLEIIDTSHDGQTGYVEFCAGYFYRNLFCQLHEKSKFIMQAGQWRYLDGVITPVADIKINRNDECPCKSGKKYKKCHSN